MPKRSRKRKTKGMPVFTIWTLPCTTERWKIPNSFSEHTPPDLPHREESSRTARYTGSISLTPRGRARCCKPPNPTEQTREERPQSVISEHVAHLTTTTATITTGRDLEAPIPSTIPTETETPTIQPTAADREAPSLRLIAIDLTLGRDRATETPITAVILQKRLS